MWAPPSGTAASSPEGPRQGAAGRTSLSFFMAAMRSFLLMAPLRAVSILWNMSRNRLYSFTLTPAAAASDRR